MVKDVRFVAAEGGTAILLFARYCWASESVRLSANKSRLYASPFA